MKSFLKSYESAHCFMLLAGGSQKQVASLTDVLFSFCLLTACSEGSVEAAELDTLEGVPLLLCALPCLIFTSSLY